MTEALLNYGLFLAKTLTLVAATLATVAGLYALRARGRSGHKEGLEIKHLNRRYDSTMRQLRAAMHGQKSLGRLMKRRAAGALRESPPTHPHNLFVLSFHGDLRASAVSSLREEITAILTIATPEDEVLLRLESGGGLVHAYGLAASQLLRFKEKGIPLTVAVDKIAASGGYMMACVADRIIAAPFAILGSIGVVAQLPNFNRWLKARNIDFEQLTAGEYKRTLTLFGENTERDREKVRHDIEDIHALFKDFIAAHRGHIDIDKVATGEHWFGKRALALGLVDELRASDDYLLAASQRRNLFEVSYAGKRSWISRLLQPVQH
jgi:serine protease SohB